MERFPKRLTTAAVCWTTVVALGVARTVMEVDGLLIWAMLACSLSLVLTGWLIAEHVVTRALRRVVAELHERDDWQLDRVADRLADALETPQNVTRLR